MKAFDILSQREPDLEVLQKSQVDLEESQDQLSAIQRWAQHPITVSFMTSIQERINSNTQEAETKAAQDLSAHKQLLENKTLRKVLNYGRTGTFE